MKGVVCGGGEEGTAGRVSWPFFRMERVALMEGMSQMKHMIVLWWSREEGLSVMDRIWDWKDK